MILLAASSHGPVVEGLPGDVFPSPRTYSSEEAGNGSALWRGPSLFELE